MTRRELDPDWTGWIARRNTRAARLEVAEHTVYRAFDEFGVLLYVGCTVNFKSRIASHRGGSLWHPYMARCDTEVFQGLRAARAVEATAIRTEGALFNATQEDANRTQANIHAANHYLWELEIYPPQYDIPEGMLDTFTETVEWKTHCAESDAYRDLHEEVRAELKAGDFPYLTPEDRLASYLGMREQRQCEAGAA